MSLFLTGLGKKKVFVILESEDKYSEHKQRKKLVYSSVFDFFYFKHSIQGFYLANSELR